MDLFSRLSTGCGGWSNPSQVGRPVTDGVSGDGPYHVAWDPAAAATLAVDDNSCGNGVAVAGRSLFISYRGPSPRTNFRIHAWFFDRHGWRLCGLAISPRIAPSDGRQLRY